MAKKFENNVNEKNLILTRAQGAVISRDFPTVDIEVVGALEDAVH